MFKINNDEENSNYVEVTYPTFGLDFIVDYEHQTLPSFDEVMQENTNDDDSMVVDSFDPLETAISVLGMNGQENSERPVKSSSTSKPRIGPASFKKKQEENENSNESDPLAMSTPVAKVKPRIGPASFKRKLEDNDETTPPVVESTPKTMSPFDILRSSMGAALNSSLSASLSSSNSVSKPGPASTKRKIEENTPTESKPRLGPASFKRMLEESNSTPAATITPATKPSIGPARFKKQLEQEKSSTTEKKDAPRIGPARFKRKIEQERSRSPSPNSDKSTPETPPKKSTPKIGPARFKRKLGENKDDSDDSAATTDTLTNFGPSGKDAAKEKKTDKPASNRPGPARFKTKTITDVTISDGDSDNDSHKLSDSVDASNIKSLTLGFIPIKKGGAVAPPKKSKSPSNTADSVRCESCNIILPSASALRAHDRATHKPSRIAQHLKVKATPKRFVSVPKYNYDSDGEDEPVPTTAAEPLKCYKCLKMIPEEDYIEHLVAHDKETQAELDVTNSTAELSKGAQLIRRYVFADPNDERNKAPDAVLRCFLCTDHLFLNREDYKYHTKTKHNIIMDNIGNESD